MKISKYYTIYFLQHNWFFPFCISKNYSLASILLSFVKFEIINFELGIINFKIIYLVKRNMENYTIIFEFGRLNDF